MPLTFISDDELDLHANDARYVANKAEDYIRVLQAEVETAKATDDTSCLSSREIPSSGM